MRVPLAAFLAWLVPGLGHIYLGHRARGLIFLVTITTTFWAGVAVGGVRGTVDPKQRKLWFLAQLCTGGNTLAGLGLHQAVEPAASAPTSPTRSSLRLGVPPARADAPAFVGHWLGADVAVHYTGVAGLLNLLVILDAILRADAARGRRPAGAPAVRDGP